MAKSKSQRERRHSRKEGSYITHDSQSPSTKRLSEAAIVEEGRKMIADAFPNALIHTALALNNLIYISCEQMECGEPEQLECVGSEEDCDNSILDESLEGTYKLMKAFEATTFETESFTSRSFDESNGSTLTSWRSEAETLASWSSDAQSMTTNGLSLETSLNPQTHLQSMFHVPSLSTSSQSALDDDCSSYLPGQLTSGGIDVSVKYIPRIQEKTQVQDQQETTLEDNSIYDSFPRSLKTERVEGQEKPSKGGFRSMTRSLKLMIRPTKIKDVDPPSEPSALIENDKDPNHSILSCGFDQSQTTENGGSSPNRRFRRSIINRKEQQSITSSSGGDIENTDLSKKSSHDSLRTRSILDRSKKSSVKNRIMGQSIGSGPEDSRSKSNRKISLISRLCGQKKDAQQAQSLDVSSTYSTTLSGPSALSTKEEDESQSYIFLAPGEKEGQEIALQDDKYFYNDPAQVHSLLTMPTFDISTTRKCAV